MQAASGDADFRAEAELAAIGELAGRVGHRNCRIDARQESFDRPFVARHDDIGVIASNYDEM